jgi:CBS-domain-containing membrane protein
MLKAKDIMTREVITVEEQTTLEEFARLLVEHQISGTPVIDSDGNLKGIATENDLINRNTKLHIPTILRLFDAFIPLGNSRLEEEIKKMAASHVHDIMTRKVITINQETSLEEIATMMMEKKIHLLPVIQEGKLVGIVGKRDLIKGISK